MSISIKNLTHIYHRGTPLEVAALSDVSLEIPGGSWTSIVGHTGSGKSTLAQHMNALLLPDMGEVVVDDLSVSSKKDLREIRRKVGLVFQYPEQQLFAETVKDELSFGPKNWGMTDNLDDLSEKVLDQVGLDRTYLDRSPFKLSGGEKRRVAIASVLAVSPSYLVLDEPTAGLDASGRGYLLKLLNKINNSGTAVVMVTHDLEIALEMSDRIIALQLGKVAHSGSPRDTVLYMSSNPVPGLLLPSIADLWVKLSKYGMEIPFSCDPSTMAKNIDEKRRGTKSEIFR